MVALFGRAGRGVPLRRLLHLQRRLRLVRGSHEVGEQLRLLQKKLEPLAAASVGCVRWRDLGRGGHRRRRGRPVGVRRGARHR